MTKKKGTGVTYKLLCERKSEDIDKLVKIYKTDRYTARIVYMNSQGGETYQSRRLGMFTEKNGDFNIVLFIKTYGITKKNVMFSNERRDVSISYKGGKFYTSFNHYGNKHVQQLTRANLGTNLNAMELHQVKQVFLEKFTWLRFLYEQELLFNTSFNKIVKEKLFSMKKALTYEFAGVPYPVAKMFKERKEYANRLCYLKTYKQYIKNIENFNKKWLDDFSLFDIFWDTVKMGRVLDRQVNCSWSDKRLISEHDKWAKIITDVVFAYDNRDLNIRQCFKDFQKLTGYKMITDTRGMALEGKRQNHCVASYVSNVDNGHCAIYVLGKYTLEIRQFTSNGQNMLKIGQLKGYRNASGPKELINEIKDYLIKFNGTNEFHEELFFEYSDDLPF